MHFINLEIPEGVLMTLEELQKTLPLFDVRLSGGFLRDLYGGAQPKDLDFMITPKLDLVESSPIYGVYAAAFVDAVNVFSRGSSSLAFKPSSALNSDYADGMRSRGVQGVIWGYCPYADMEGQLIVYSKWMNTTNAARDMDINICQVCTRPVDNRVLATPAFVKGFKHKFIEVLNGQGQEREKERVQRMLIKYPDFEVRT